MDVFVEMEVDDGIGVGVMLGVGVSCGVADATVGTAVAGKA